MHTRIGIALSIGATLILALSAAASSLPAPPAPISSACLSVTVTPHVVSAGGVVSASTGPGTGGCTQSHVEWNWFVNGEKDSTCGTSSTTCAIKTTRPTIGYRPICAVGTGTSPGIQACDYVAVVASGTFTVSGRIGTGSPLIKRLAEKTPKLANVADATVEAVNSDGDAITTKTAADGSYSLGVPAGRYTIRVDPEAGIGYHGTTTPASRTVVVKGDVGNVNFRLGRIIHLEGEAEFSGFGSERGALIDLRFRQGKKVVGIGAADCSLVCVGRTRIEGVVGRPWLRLAWRSDLAKGGEGVITTDKVELDDDGKPNYPSEENFYEGAITVHTGPIEDSRNRRHPFAVTIELI